MHFIVLYQWLNPINLPARRFFLKSRLDQCGRNSKLIQSSNEMPPFETSIQKASWTKAGFHAGGDRLGGPENFA
jgi:hypothetical protein